MEKENTKLNTIGKAIRTANRALSIKEMADASSLECVPMFIQLRVAKCCCRKALEKLKETGLKISTAMGYIPAYQ